MQPYFKSVAQATPRSQDIRHWDGLQIPSDFSSKIDVINIYFYLECSFIRFSKKNDWTSNFEKKIYLIGTVTDVKPKI